MPNILYNRLLETACLYVPPTKASELVSRQIANAAATPDTFTLDHLKQSKIRIRTVLGLYIPDETKRKEMQEKIEALA